MTDNILPFEQPSHIKSKCIEIPLDGLREVGDELHKFLRKTPYAKGSPIPTGTLTIYCGVAVLFFEMRMYTHGGFSTSCGLTLAQEKLKVEFTNVPREMRSVMNEALAYLRRRGYPLQQVFDIHAAAHVESWHWVWEPAHGYESISLTITYPKEN